MNRRKFLRLVLAGSAGTLAAAYPVFIERYLFQINHYTIPVPNLPRTFDGFTIVHLTDLHLGFLMPLPFIQKILHKVRRIKKDLIVCTGDYVRERNSRTQTDIIWPELLQLAAPCGVWSVLGNHDHWADADRALYWLERSGQNLRHRAVSVERDGKRIWIGGAGDLWEDVPGIDRAFRNVPPAECKILLAHNPDTVDTEFETRVDLCLSGHTHGGQVRLPFTGAPVLPVKNKRYSSGLIETEKTQLYISRGLGWSILPVRFNCLPEIPVLRLVCGS